MKSTTSTLKVNIPQQKSKQIIHGEWKEVEKKKKKKYTAWQFDPEIKSIVVNLEEKKKKKKNTTQPLERKIMKEPFLFQTT